MIRRSVIPPTIAMILTIVVLSGARAAAQGGGRGAEQGRGRGGSSFPAQQRQLADAAVIAKGKGIYETMCGACHGIDLRGGQLGGPNLLRSQTVLLDRRGELIGPVIVSGRPNPAPPAPAMPPFPMSPDDLTAVSEYIHSVLAQGGRQGRPPIDDTVAPERVLVGDPAAGEKYFQATCAGCHSTSGDLKGLASRVADARELQNLWVSGGGGGGRGGGRGRGGTSSRATVKITPTGGATIEGRLSRIDDFLVSVILADGSRRTFPRRTATDPRIELNDPAEAHRRMVAALADKDMHDVTAYLWTIK
ncbi:MAG TPA: c-type cytochrome [Vicinamibacterales bacterium]|nr:c-type cytochrome [Vicinamibacterales bacterium]